MDTRLSKVAAGEYDAIVLAKAGVDRLGLSSRITEVLSPEVMLPAIGQGALGVEFCEPRREEFKILDLLMNQDTMRAVKAERALLAEVQGGCRLPLGAWARMEPAGWCWTPACCPRMARNPSAGARKKFATPQRMRRIWDER